MASTAIISTNSRTTKFVLKLGGINYYHHVVGANSRPTEHVNIVNNPLAALNWANGVEDVASTSQLQWPGFPN